MTTKTMTEIAEELERIRQLGGGILRPVVVVEYAQDPETALHRHFTWNDGEAAHEYRLWQAREIIRVRVQLIPQTKKTERVYVSLARDRRIDGGGYRTIVDVLSDDEMSAEMLEEAKRDADAFRFKYQRLRRLAPVFAAMDEAFPKAA